MRWSHPEGSEDGSEGILQQRPRRPARWQPAVRAAPQGSGEEFAVTVQMDPVFPILETQERVWYWGGGPGGASGGLCLWVFVKC